MAGSRQRGGVRQAEGTDVKGGWSRWDWIYRDWGRGGIGGEGAGHRAVGKLEVDVRDAGGGEGGGVECIRIVQPHLRAA